MCGVNNAARTSERMKIYILDEATKKKSTTHNKHILTCDSFPTASTWQPSTNSGEIFLLTIAFLSYSLTRWNYLCATMNQPTLSLSLYKSGVCVCCAFTISMMNKGLYAAAIRLIWHLLLLLSFLYLSFSCSTKIKHTSTSIQAIFQSGKLAQHIQFNHYGDWRYGGIMRERKSEKECSLRYQTDTRKNVIASQDWIYTWATQTKAVNILSLIKINW